MNTNNIATMMGFARFEKRDSVEAQALIEASLRFRREFLYTQPGIVKHCLLANLEGQFADAIFASNRESYDEMVRRYPEQESASGIMSLLEPSSVRLTPTAILGDQIRVPDDFACLEFGTFEPKQPGQFSEGLFVAASRRVESQYLSSFAESKGYFVGKVDDDTYAEVALVQSLGAAREICGGYGENPVCADLVALFDPASVDLDFWYLLA